MKQLRIVWRDDSMDQNNVRSITKDRNGDFTINELSGSITYIPKDSVYSINVTEIGEK